MTSTQNQPTTKELAEKAQHEYATGHFADAERDFRELVKRDPNNIYAQVYLGQSLFRQEKYDQAVIPFEKARNLENAGIKLTLVQHRILVDQLAMSYGISGKSKECRALLESAIREDPDYPLNYYNLACLNAQEGNKRELINDLTLVFQHRDHVLNGEEMPNPRKDSSFEKYVNDPDFVALMKKLGYE
ncbi:MAG TPA: tetratricopeptide repeat protein [Terriglobales bacterium]|nr:tetratricopeptide repeat protein [Terriglobales bacterium]